MPNISNATMTGPVHPWAVQATLILDNYINRALGGVGILVNLFFVILLSHRTLRNKIYDFLWCRQFASLITCLSVVASFGFSFEYNYDFEWLGYFAWCTAITIRVFSLASFISDILLISNRYFEVSRKTTFLKRLSKKLNLFFCLMISFSFFLPAYLSVYVVKNPLNGTFKLSFNVFGASVYFKVYFFVLFLIETIMPLSLFLWLNIVSRLAFKHLMQRHADLTGNQSMARSAEDRFTKMVLLLSAVTLVTRLIDMVASTFNRISIIAPSAFNQSNLELILFSKTLSFNFISTALAIDALVYLRMDKNIWRLILNLTGYKRVI